jgi:hypothetical protein
MAQRHLATYPRALLFQDGDEPWTRHNLLKQYRRLLARAGVTYRRFHALRHTCATNLLKAGCYLPAVSRRLGHSKVSTTLDIYAAYLPSDQAPLAMSFERMALTWIPKSLQSSVDGYPMGAQLTTSERSRDVATRRQKEKISEKLSLFGDLEWCAREDLNLHAVASASPSS